ncbi:DsbA family protein [Erythrobacter mangrovi]|uniref:Thioredoxin domain-containing protein n=1 Tax=Erythrobacter mangrovi TaxID=2739433 RepID=A0A7D3XH91_9SPHN|nr:thioredoxin domain-containing protein [Erythrobacter mangrovi]QKG70279.1 thioredoxin domain-containing protein [Erythrobacter mangrovi]
MTKSFRFALAAPLALALAACGSGADDTASLEGDAIAAIPAPEGTQWIDKAVATPDGGTLVGNPDAPLKLIEYGSLTCPTCARFSIEGSDELLNDYVNSGRVSFELRQFAIHGPIDLLLGRLTNCGPVEAIVPLSDQVWKSHEAIMQPLTSNQAAFQAAMERPIEQRFVVAAQQMGYLDFFAQRGISEDQARQCLADVPAIEKAAADTQKYATEFKINGTPTFVLNGKTVEANTWAALEPILQRAGAR